MPNEFYGLVPGRGDNDEVIKFTSQDMAEHPELVYYVYKLKELEDEMEKTNDEKDENNKPF